MEYLIIIALLAVLLILWVISIQRKLVEMDENVNNAMNQIGIQLSCRFEALTALVDYTKGYNSQESKNLMESIKSRRSVINAYSTPEEVQLQENLIAQVLERIEAVAQQHPEMKNSESYWETWKAVDTYEGMVHTSRLIYNDGVTRLNRAVRMIPINLIAPILGFSTREYLENTQEVADIHHRKNRQ